MQKVAIVTGASQGLGKALVRGLCRRLGDEGCVYLAARDLERGRRAVSELEQEGLSPQLVLLDVTDSSRVAAVADELARAHGGVDIVISNAAARISPDVPAAAQVRGFFDTNNGGARRVLRAFVPHLRDGARLLVVASSFGRLSLLPEAVRERLDPRSNDLEALAAAEDEYVGLVERGGAVEAGWPEWINVPSKVGQVSAMAHVAAKLRADAARRDILIDAVCPGLVDTDASRPWFPDMSQALSPDAAAEDVLWLATLPRGEREPYGALVQHRKALA